MGAGYFLRPFGKTVKNRDSIVQVFLKRPVVAPAPGCSEKFIRKETLWNTYPLETLD
jgi:hypothetical protein